MEHRSSITTFAAALLTDAACYRDGSIEGMQNEMKKDKKTFRDILEETLKSERLTSTQAARKFIPGEDWEEILAYICRWQEAYGFAAVVRGASRWPEALLPWLASIAVRAIDDIGR